jgi:hypothetical protein
VYDRVIKNFSLFNITRRTVPETITPTEASPHVTGEDDTPVRLAKMMLEFLDAYKLYILMVKSNENFRLHVMWCHVMRCYVMSCHVMNSGFLVFSCLTTQF